MACFLLVEQEGEIQRSQRSPLTGFCDSAHDLGTTKHTLIVVPHSSDLIDTLPVSSVCLGLPLEGIPVENRCDTAGYSSVEPWNYNCQQLCYCSLARDLGQVSFSSAGSGTLEPQSSTALLLLLTCMWPCSSLFLPVDLRGQTKVISATPSFLSCPDPTSFCCLPSTLEHGRRGSPSLPPPWLPG